MVSVDVSVTEDVKAEYRTSFGQRGWLFLPGFVSSEQAALWEKETQIQVLPGRNAFYDDENISWYEQDPTEDHGIYRWFTGTSVVQFLENISRPPSGQLWFKENWLNRYATGEYIEPHKDGGGYVQLLLCLHSQPNEGGLLHLAPDNADEQVLALTPGDAIIFQASSITHWTTPVTATGQTDTPHRVIAVARYEQHNPHTT